MKTLFHTLIVLIIFSYNLIGQIEFSEEANLLGCGDSTYGLGLLGGGISFFDFDRDGWDDITISSEDGDPVRFFKNNTGTFIEVSFNFKDPFFETKTVQWVDFDNDGDFDLFVTSNTDSNRLYKNIGSMTFEDITVSSGLNVLDNETYGGSWGDYNNDGWLDLFICSRSTTSGVGSNFLFKNNQNSTFTDVNDIAGLTTENHLSFCAVFFDYNNDGWQDIYIANDKYNTPNLLYKNNGNGTFLEVGEETGTNISIDAMSTTIGDYNKDGWLDIYIANTINGNVFFKNNGDGTFTNVAYENGTIFESVAWGSVFLDAENDTDLDLYVSGELDGETSFLPSAFYENDGMGNFSIPFAAGFDNDTARSFSNAMGDINNDGYPDIIVLNYEPHDIFIWKNQSPQNNNWIKIKLEGVDSNKQGIGSWIEISVNGNKQYNYTLCGEGYLGQNSAYEFFGIGESSVIDYIKVTWLSGNVDIIINPMINSHTTIIEGENLGLNNDSNMNTRVLIYPNPGKIFSLKIDNHINNIDLTVTDMTGKLVLKKELTVTDNKVNMSHFVNGIYLFNLVIGNALISKKVIVK